MIKFSFSPKTTKTGKHSAKSLVLTSFICTFSALSLSGCSSTPVPSTVDTENGIYDPYEEYNRTMTSFNLAVDHAVINPVVEGYRTITPAPAREGISNVMKNLRSPVNFVNQLLQGDLEGAGNVLVRAVVNTTIGIGGIFDVAGKEGIPYESEDFGQTLAVWGVHDGPYLVVPFIGASTLRDYGGLFADTFADPVRWYAYNTDNEGIYYAKTGVDYFLLRDSLYDTMTELEQSSFDYYAAVRSAYYQYRKAAILDSVGATDNTYDDLPEIPDFDE